MLQLDIQKFLKEGSLFDDNGSVMENWIVDKLGIPDEIEKYDNGKYLHYGSLRLLFMDDFLKGVTIFFMNSKSKYKIEIDEEGFEIGAGMHLTSLVNMLNKLSLRWKIPFEQSNLDYLLLQIDSGVKVYYYLENNQLERITKDIP